MASIKGNRRIIQHTYGCALPHGLVTCALEQRHDTIPSLKEDQLVRIMHLPGNRKTSVALYALMEHIESPQRLGSLNGLQLMRPKLSAAAYGYIQLARRPDT